MSESEHSLPPDVKNKAHGQLKVRIGDLVWMDPSLAAAQILFRIKFWGERGPGVILKPTSSSIDMISNEVAYTIRCTQPSFISYLMDMGSLNIDVTDSQWRLLGSIKVNFKLYLKKDSSSKLNLASNFGFSNIEVQGVFPIILSSTPPKKIGEVELSILTLFGEVYGKVSHEVETVQAKKPEIPKKQENLAKVEFSKKLDRLGDEGLNQTPQFDNRVAYSLAKEPRGEYNSDKVKNNELENKETFKNYREERNIIKKIKEEKELPKEDLKNDSNMSLEWENLKNRAERLIKKVEASSNNEEAYEEPVRAREDEFMIPSISELKALSFPQAPSNPKSEVQEKAFQELNSVTHLKLQISTMHMLVYRRDSNPYLECIVPLPSTEGSRNDSFKTSHKSVSGDSYIFNHESLHHLVIADGIFSKLAPSTIKFKLMLYEKGKVQELGKAELLWEKLLLSKGFNLSSELELLTEETKSKKSVQKIVAKLGVSLTLINENRPAEPALDRVKISEPSKSYLLYLYVDHVTKLKQPLQNLYITYKTFPEPERITTDVLWNYKDSQPVNHKMVTAVMATESVTSKLSVSNLVIEVWNKPNSGNDELLGMTKLPLQLFSSYITAGDALSNSVYPIIAFDEFRSINSLKTGEEIGLIKVCLAMGSPLQINKLRSTHEVLVRTWAPEPEPVEDKKEEVYQIDKEESVQEPKLELVEKSIQMDEFKYDKDDLLAQSIESIGDIADLLNQRTKAQDDKFRNEPRAAEDKPQAVEPQVVDSIEFVPPIVQQSENLFSVPQALSPEEVVEALKERLEQEAINLEEELKIADRFQYGYMHRESLAYFLQELRLGFTPSQISSFIDHILAARSTSNTRRVMFSDILSTLGLIHPLYTKHSFIVTISSIYSCPLLNKLAGSQFYVKYLFPTESNFIESEMLEASSSVQVNLKSVHSCTFPSASSLDECFSEKHEGITVFLCRYGTKGEERVIGKGILPIEEIVELESTSKINRVICLYGDLSEQLGIMRNDLIGKIRLAIDYTSSFAYDAISASSELVFEKQTQVDRKIHRNQILTVILESITEFARGLKYLKSAGAVFTNKNKFRFNFSPFHEDRELANEYPAVDLVFVNACDKLSINEAKYIELVLSAKSLEYFNHQTSLLTVMFDKELVGTCKIPLLQLLLHSSLKGEYAVLNEFGQFMGLVQLTLSFGLEEVQPKRQIEPEPTVQSSKLLLSVDSALNLPFEHNGESLNSFIQFAWVDGRIFESKPIFKTSCPRWNFYQDLVLPLDLKWLRAPLVICLMHKSPRGPVKLGEAVIELEPLVNSRCIDGWYHVLDGNLQVGQIKVKITSEEDLYFRMTGKVKQEVFDRLPSPKIIEKTVTVAAPTVNKYEERLKNYHQSLEMAEDDDIIAKHYDNMKAIENLSKTLELRLSGSSQSLSINRKSPERQDFSRFVPLESIASRSPPRFQTFTSAHEKRDSPLRQPAFHSAVLRTSGLSLSREYPEYKREVSPPQSHFSHPLKKSRETSPLAEYYRVGHEIEKIEKLEQLEKFEKFERFEQAEVLKSSYSYERSPAKEVRKSVERLKQSPDFMEKYSNIVNNPSEFSPLRVSHQEGFRSSENFDRHQEVWNHRVEDNEEDDWDPDRVADVLKTIQEAAGYGGSLDEEDQEYNFRRNDSEFTLGDREGMRIADEERERKLYGGQILNKDENFEEKREKVQKNEEFEERREVWKITPEKIESVIENVNKRRMSPKLSRPALPKSLLSDPEISRIAAIMKGNK